MFRHLTTDVSWMVNLYWSYVPYEKSAKPSFKMVYVFISYPAKTIIVFTWQQRWNWVNKNALIYLFVKSFPVQFFAVIPFFSTFQFALCASSRGRIIVYFPLFIVIYPFIEKRNHMIVVGQNIKLVSYHFTSRTNRLKRIRRHWPSFWDKNVLNFCTKVKSWHFKVRTQLYDHRYRNLRCVSTESGLVIKVIILALIYLLIV